MPSDGERVESRVIVGRFHLESRRKRFCSCRLIKKRRMCGAEHLGDEAVETGSERETQRLRGRKDREI